MTQCAVIPKGRRISALMPTADPGEPGFTMPLAVASVYYQYGRAHLTHGNALSSERERPLIRKHGMAVLMEIFDSVYVDIKFNGTDLIDELQTIRDYKRKTQYCIISAVLRWAAAEKEPQVRKSGGQWILCGCNHNQH